MIDLVRMKEVKWGGGIHLRKWWHSVYLRVMYSFAHNL